MKLPASAALWHTHPNCKKRSCALSHLPHRKLLSEQGIADIFPPWEELWVMAPSNQFIVSSKKFLSIPLKLPQSSFAALPEGGLANKAQFN